VKFSAIIPAFNEGAQIASALKRLRQISRASPLEIILVDGGSDDDTVALARPWADRAIVLEGASRGAQLDAGARAASGELLLFLSADAQPSGGWQHALENFWLSPRLEKVAATAFLVDYGTGFPFRLASALSNASARWRGLAGAEHGLATTPEIYRASGGFPHLVRGEGRAFCLRLKRLGGLVVLSERVHCAARRLRRAGAVRCALEELLGALRSARGRAPAELTRRT